MQRRRANGRRLAGGVFLASRSGLDSLHQEYSRRNLCWHSLSALVFFLRSRVFNSPASTTPQQQKENKKPTHSHTGWRRCPEGIARIAQRPALLSPPGSVFWATTFYRQTIYRFSRSMLLFFPDYGVFAVLLGRRIIWFKHHSILCGAWGYNTKPLAISSAHRPGIPQDCLGFYGTQAGWGFAKKSGFVVDDQPTRWTRRSGQPLGTTAGFAHSDRTILPVEHVFISLPLNRYHEPRHVF